MHHRPPSNPTSKGPHNGVILAFLSRLNFISLAPSANLLRNILPACPETQRTVSDLSRQPTRSRCRAATITQKRRALRSPETASTVERGRASSGHLNGVQPPVSSRRTRIDIALILISTNENETRKRLPPSRSSKRRGRPWAKTDAPKKTQP